MTETLSAWLEAYLRAVREAFGARIWFIGLQGSHGRGEAVPGSDLDVVLILDRVGYAEVDAYGRVLDGLPCREKICGFFSGRAELEAWDRAELFQFCNDTTPLQGSLDELAAAVAPADVRRAVHTSACSLYHACVHNALHEQSPQALAALYKSAAFALQAAAYLQHGVFIRQQQALVRFLEPGDRAILERHLALRAGVSTETPEALTRALMAWAAEWILRTA